MTNIKVGIDAFNDLAKSHDAHVKEVERLQEELNELNKLKLVDQHGELLLECRIGDENHRLLLEVGLNTILEKILKEENNENNRRAEREESYHMGDDFRRRTSREKSRHASLSEACSLWRRAAHSSSSGCLVKDSPKGLDLQDYRVTTRRYSSFSSRKGIRSSEAEEC